MKKILLSIGIGCLLLFIGCESQYTQSVEMFGTSTNGLKYKFKYAITVIDNCEYITFPNSEGGVQIAHKGNCTNCQAIFRAWYAENK